MQTVNRKALKYAPIVIESQSKKIQEVTWALNFVILLLIYFVTSLILALKAILLTVYTLHIERVTDINLKISI